MKPHEFFILLLLIIVGVFAALVCWTLVIKNQVTAQLAANPTATNALTLLSTL